MFQSNIFQLIIELWDSSNENTEHFANIWKADLAPFAPPNYAPKDVHFILINIGNCNGKCYFWDFHCYSNVICVTDLSAEKSLSTYFELFTIFIMSIILKWI